MSEIAIKEGRDSKGLELKIARLRAGLKHMESTTARAIRVRYIAVPNASDAKERLSRAVAILLKAGIKKGGHKR